MNKQWNIYHLSTGAGFRNHPPYDMQIFAVHESMNNQLLLLLVLVRSCSLPLDSPAMLNMLVKLHRNAIMVHCSFNVTQC